MINLTIAWAQTIEVEIDPLKIDDPLYIDKIKSGAIKNAAANLSWKDGMVTDCEEFSEFID